ncbi:MAG: glycoside hydrolase family 88 protein [Lachnospiraceae bacterium]|nr:glycoside hydrolase family 88 protein [Lachnospiraceae bacterium]
MELTLTPALAAQPAITDEEVRTALDTAIRQTESCLEEFSLQFKHTFSYDNFYGPAPNDQWTNGFWTGELWLAYENTGRKEFLEAARAQVESFRSRIDHNIETDTHDLGFLYSPSCVAAYKLTGDLRARETALLAAKKLASRFHEKGQFIQAWGALDNRDNYRLIIDCLLNLPLLFWASKETGDSKFEKLAKAHLNTALNVVIRPDYSTYHTYYFDPDTGEPVKGVTHQGYSADSAWSRGQSWGVYGIALGYAYTQNETYPELFSHVTNYFLEHLPSDLIPYWDFTFTDGSTEPRDSSASAVVACGLLEAARHLPEKEADTCKQIARKLMKVLVDRCSAQSPEESNGQLLHGVYGRKTPYNDCIDHGIDECNLWGDYYYVEALTRLSKDWNPYW